MPLKNYLTNDGNTQQSTQWYLIAQPIPSRKSPNLNQKGIITLFRKENTLAIIDIVIFLFDNDI